MFKSLVLGIVLLVAVSMSWMSYGAYVEPGPDVHLHAISTVSSADVSAAYIWFTQPPVGQPTELFFQPYLLVLAQSSAASQTSAFVLACPGSVSRTVPGYVTKLPFGALGSVATFPLNPGPQAVGCTVSVFASGATDSLVVQ